MFNSARELVPDVLDIFRIFNSFDNSFGNAKLFDRARESVDILVLESQRDGRMCIDVSFFSHIRLPRYKLFSRALINNRDSKEKYNEYGFCIYNQYVNIISINCIYNQCCLYI